MGLAAARQLAAKGANIIIVARSVEKLETALGEIKVRTYLLPSQRQRTRRKSAGEDAEKGGENREPCTDLISL